MTRALIVRWVLRQGPVSLVLTVLGMAAFTVAGFMVYSPAGWVVAGAACWYLEHLTREPDRP